MSLKSDLEGVFSAMGDAGDDGVFAKGVAGKVAAYIKSGKITTTDLGEIEAGSYSGAGTGAMDVDASICEGVISAACASMKKEAADAQSEAKKSPDAEPAPMKHDDKYLAEQMKAGIEKMLKAGKAKTTVTGTVTTKAGVASPLGGQAEGAFTGDASVIKTKLDEAFASMNGEKEKGCDLKAGDSVLAGALAEGVHSCMTAWIVSTDGKGAIEKVKGTGAGVWAEPADPSVENGAKAKGGGDVP